jgi:hypothetical protein
MSDTQRALRWTLLATLLPALVIGARADAQIAPLLPYHCYEVDREGPPFALNGVILDGHFGASTVNLRRLKRLCNPALVGLPKARGTDGAASANHLTGYEIRNPQPPFTPVHDLMVVDVFGPLTIDLIRPTVLLVPTAKDLKGPPPPSPVPGVDHFECYQVKGGRRRTPIFILDQFGEVEAAVKKPLWFCPAVSKNNEPTVDLDNNLLCYQLRTKPAHPNVGDIFIDNQFGPSTIHVTRSRELCVPASIVGATASPTPTPEITPSPTPTPIPCALGAGNLCSGTCPGGQVCLGVSQQQCGCVDTATACGLMPIGTAGGSQCGGLCPNPSDVCVLAGPTCLCTD